MLVQKGAAVVGYREQLFHTHTPHASPSVLPMSATTPLHHDGTLTTGSLCVMRG